MVYPEPLYPSEELYPSETLYPSDGVTVATSTLPVAVIRERPPDQLAVKITSPEGAEARWANDEPLARNVIDDLEIVDEIPGGYKELRGVLARNPQTNWPDLKPYSTVKAIQPGGEKVFEGFMGKPAEVSGDQVSVSPEVLGNQFILQDNQDVRVGYIDSDLTKWGASPTERVAYLLANNIKLIASTNVGLSTLDPSGELAMILDEWLDVETVEAPYLEAGEAYYDSGGIDIGKVLYNFKSFVGLEDTTWENTVALGQDQKFTTFVAGKDHNAALSAPEQMLEATGEGYRWARLRDFITVASENVKVGRLFGWYLKVIGRNALGVEGVWPEIGFYSSQMLLHFINTFCAPLEATEESLDNDGFLISQAWYVGQPAPDIVTDLVKYSLYDWFVYNGNLFELRKPGTYGRKWKAYVGPSNLNELGQDSQSLWRSVVVTYTDVDGSDKSVGPVGSNASVETEQLEITDPLHPAVLANRTRKGVLSMNGVSTYVEAIKTGIRFLEEANQINRSGSATLTGYILDEKGIERPTAQVKSGDWISFVDAHDTSYRKIVNKSYRHNERSAEIDLDAPPAAMEVLLERLQASIPSGI